MNSLFYQKLKFCYVSQQVWLRMITTFISPTLGLTITLPTMVYRSPALLRFAFECVPPTRQAVIGRSSATVYRETSMKSLSTRCQQFSSLSTSEWCKKMNSSKICLDPKPTSFPGFAFLSLRVGRTETLGTRLATCLYQPRC